MALIEIDGLPSYIAWWIFPWRTVCHNQRVHLLMKINRQFINGVFNYSIPNKRAIKWIYNDLYDIML